MLVRINWTNRSPYRLERHYQTFALTLATILAPAALLAFTLALWRIAADLRWTNDFFLSQGFFAHWQTWLVIASLFASGAALLNGVRVDDPDASVSAS